MLSRYYAFNDNLWAIETGKLIAYAISECLRSSSSTSLFLPAGNTAASLYPRLNILLADKGPINFYLTDERLDATSDKFSNELFVASSMVDAINSGGNMLDVFPKKMSLYDEMAVENFLPSAPNVVVLSLADDGHFASIFEYQEKLSQIKTKHFIASCERYPFDRISISPSYINSAQYTFLLAPGKIKRDLIDSEDKLSPLRMIDNYILVTSE